MALINIQFMDNSNKRTNKEGRTYYVPNYDKMIENACCDEERKAIENCRDLFDRLDDGFTFEIVYTIYTKLLHQDLNTLELTWDYEWTIYQHPWYRSEKGIYVSKEEMVRDIAAFHFNEEDK